MTRLIARMLAGVAAVPLIAMVAVACVTPITLSGLLYLLGCGLVVAGTLTAPWRRHNYRWIGRAGCLLLALVAATRLWRTAQSSTVTMLTLPAHGRARWINRLIDEQDVALVGARVLAIARLTTRREGHDLVPVIARAYRQMRAAEGPTPSPFVSTYLNREHPNAFDAVVVEPPAGRSTQAGLIFLHGFTGNFTLPCWLVARAVRTSGAITVCPSVGWRGDWWTEDGAATVRATLDYLRERGVQRVYLGGLSNGGFGASELVARLDSEIAGLILISGASPSAQTGDVPALLLHGRYDERVPAAVSRTFAQRAGANATYIEFQSDHFALVREADAMGEAIATWLARQEARYQ